MFTKFKQWLKIMLWLSWFATSTREKLLWLLAIVSVVYITGCSDPTDEHGLPIVYPVVTAKDAGFEINGKKVTKIIIENDTYTSNNHYMYVISTVPVEAHNSVMIPSAGKGTYPKHVTNVEIP